jgi:dUTP pyrophosphatase
MTLQIKRIHPQAVLPAYAHAGDAGMDVCSVDELTIEPGARALVKTGLVFLLPEGWEAQVRPRSGLALKKGVTVLNSPGTIDAGYRGEVGVILINLGREPFAIKPGDRIAQIVLAPVTQAEIREAAAIDETDRGTGGFGSTGV